MDRRRRADERKRQAGHVRLQAWVAAERLDDLDALVTTWTFASRAEAVEVAIRFLLAKSSSMTAIEL